jgi:hypothetical protein
MSIRSVLAVAAGAAVVLSAAIWYMGADSVDPRREPGASPESIGVSGGARVAAKDRLVDPGDSTTDGTVEPDGVALRRSVPSDALTGRVVRSTTGLPIADAVVSWTSLPESLEEPWIRRADVANEVPATSVETRTAADGVFFFNAVPPPMGGGSVIWITSSNHEPRAVLCGPEPRDLPTGREWSLTPAAAVQVRVVDSVGAPVAGATVVQSGIDITTIDDNQPARLAWLLLRAATTGTNGTALVVPLAGRHRLSAHLGNSESGPFEGEAAPSTTLELGATFRVGGLLRWSPELSESTAVHLNCESIVGPHAVELVRTRVRAGTWGPLSLPLTGAPEYRFRLEGDGVVARAHVVSAPRAGDVLTIDFDVDPGHMLWFQVVDEAGATPPGVEVTVRWDDRGTQVARASQARSDGFVAVWGCPDGAVMTSVRAPGFVRADLEAIQLPLEEEGFIPVTMVRAGSIGGVVVEDGRPVDTFEIVVWPHGQAAHAQRYPFASAPDGRFELNEVPLGELTVIATAIGRTQSRPTIASVVDGRAAEVLLALEPTVTASGRVVDAATTEPIADATIRVPASDGFGSIGTTGPPHLVASDGAFFVEGVAPRLAVLTVTAPGYSSRDVSAPVSGANADFGTIALQGRQHLEVYLRHDAGVAPDRFELSIDGPDGPRSGMFDGEGRARFEALSAGDYAISVRYPDSTWRRAEVALVAGEDWYVEFNATTGATVRVEIVHDGGDSPNRDWWVSLQRVNRQGSVFCTANLDSANRAVFRNVPASTQVVSLHGHPDGGSRVVASTRVALVDGDDLTVTLRVDDVRKRFRVVDERGDPLQGVSVSVNLSGDGFGFSARDLTDADGTCVVPGLSADDVLVHLGHAERGYSLGLPVTVSPAGAVTEVVFQASVTTELVLSRRTGPVVGGGGRFCDLQYTRAIRGPISDERGVSTWSNLAPGDYVFVFDEAGYWPIHKPVTVRDGAPPIQIDLYRLCSVRLEVTHAGKPVPGAEVFMQRIGGSVPLSEFLPSGLVVSSTGSMNTGPDGAVELDQVAEARYAWRVSMPDGTTTDGAVEVEPDRPAIVQITL